MIEENPIPVLMYHEVTDSPEIGKKIRRIDPDYSLNIDVFKNHMGYLFDKGYHTISCDDLIENHVRDEKQCVLTFDDGLAGNYQFARPILDKYDFKATIFVVVDGISTERFMTWKQLAELAENGFLIQSHTMTHADLSRLSDREKLYELSESKKSIEKNVGREVKYLSLPFGSGDTKVFQIAGDLGYKAIFTSSFYQMNMNCLPAIYGRIPIKSSDSEQSYKKLLSKKYTQLQRKMITALMKNGIKRIVGLNNYRKVYRLVYKIKLD